MRAYLGNITLSGITAPGIVVEFDKPWRLVLWSKAQYVPCWDLGRGVWSTLEWLETISPDNNHCYEPIMDKKNRYIRAEIIESGDARVTVRWHYALCDSRYRIFHGNTTADEYWMVYPDGVAVRKLVAWPGNESDFGGNPDVWEVMEFMIINGDGTTPKENLEKPFFTLQNEEGDSVPLPEKRDKPLCIKYPQIADWNIYIGRIYVADRPDPFVIFPRHRALFPFVNCHDCHKEHPHFEYMKPYNVNVHWPIYDKEDFVGGLDPEDLGNRYLASHTSLFNCQYSHRPHGSGFSGALIHRVSPNRPTTWLFLTGATEDLKNSYLQDLAKSWLYPAKIRVGEEKHRRRISYGDYYLLYEGYSYSERAYVFRKSGKDNVVFTVKPRVKVVNPVFIINQWASREVTVSVNGENLSEEEYKAQLSGEDLIVWLNRDITESTEVRIFS